MLKMASTTNPLYQVVKRWYDQFLAEIHQFYDHNVTKGTTLEVLVQNFFKAMLGAGVGVGPAILIGPDGKALKQQLDLVIYRSDSPTFYPPGAGVPFVLGRSVVAVVEVKTQYQSHKPTATAATAIRKAAETAKFILFAFQSKVSWHAIGKTVPEKKKEVRYGAYWFQRIPTSYDFFLCISGPADDDLGFHMRDARLEEVEEKEKKEKNEIQAADDDSSPDLDEVVACSAGGYSTERLYQRQPPSKPKEQLGSDQDDLDPVASLIVLIAYLVDLIYTPSYRLDYNCLC